MLYAVVVFLRYGTFLAGQMGRQVGQEDTARDQQDANAPQEGDLLLQEHRAAALFAAAEAAEEIKNRLIAEIRGNPGSPAQCKR